MLKLISLLMSSYRLKREERRYHKAWSKLLRSDGKAPDIIPEGSHKTRAIVGDGGLIVEYMDGRMVGQRGVAPLYIDSTNWGGMK